MSAAPGTSTAGDPDAQLTQDAVADLVEVLPDPLVILQPVRDDSGEVADFTISYANEASARLWGRPLAELLGRRLLGVFASTLEMGIFDSCVSAVESGQPARVGPFEFDDNGVTGTFELSATRWRDAVVVVVRDVTHLRSTPPAPLAGQAGWRDIPEEQQARAELTESAARFRLAMENSVIGMCLISPDGNFLMVNPALCAMLGRDEEVLRATTWQELTHPDDLATDEHLVADVLAGRIPSYRLSKRYLRPDGSVIWGDLSVAAVRRGDGSVRYFISQIVDSTERHIAAAALADSEQRYRLVVDNMFDVVLRSRDGDVMWVSPSLTRELGWEPQEWMGRPLTDFLLPGDHERWADDSAVVRDEGSSVNRFRLRAKDGAYHWAETHTGAFRDESGEPDGVVTSFRVIDREVRAEQELQRNATIDDLTGALNRDEAIALLDAVVSHPRRDPGEQCAIVFCDVDDFKEINDTRGHTGGDRWLRETTQRIRAAIRHEDAVARMGGDEFLVILNGVHDLAEATAIAEKIRESVLVPVTTAAGTITGTMSVGVTLATAGEPVDDMIRRADRAMYKAKRAGRNQVVPLTHPG